MNSSISLRFEIVEVDVPVGIQEELRFDDYSQEMNLLHPADWATFDILVDHCHNDLEHDSHDAVPSSYVRFQPLSEMHRWRPFLSLCQRLVQQYY
jgi:hypothetical protein